VGIYVYTLRKKHIEANLEGIWPIDVISIEYAFKESYGMTALSREYKMMEARFRSQAMKAVEHYKARAIEEFGTDHRDFFVVQGGFEDGNPVFKIDRYLPIMPVDAYFDCHDDRVERVGSLFKIKRGDWIVSKTCPSHKWYNYTLANDGTTVYQCERCDAFKDERFNGVKKSTLD